MEKTNSENGYVTPQMQADFLKRYGHLEGSSMSENGNIINKYYTMRGEGYKVMMYDGKAIQINKIGANEAKVMAECSGLKFGDF